MSDYDYKKNKKLDTIPKNAGKIYEKILFESYEDTEIYKEPETGFYISKVGKQSYETTSIEFIKNEIDDFINNLPAGTSNNQKNKKVKENYKTSSDYNKPWTDDRDFIDKTIDFFKASLFSIFMFVQAVTYPMALIKWFIRDFPYFWSGFKELAFALIPIINILYVIDYWAIPLKILTLPLHFL